MLLGNIFRVNGGMAHAVYRRANALVSAGMEVTLFTFHYHRDFHGLLYEYRSEGVLDPRVEVLNLFERAGNDDEQVRYRAPVEGETAFPDKNDRLARRVFNRLGEYVAYEARDSTGVLKFVDRFEAPWVRVSKEIYDAKGRLRRVLYMEKASNSPDFSVTFNADGRPQVSSKLTKGKPRSFFSHFDQIEYPTELDVVIAWMKRCLGDRQALVVLSEKREMIVPLLAVGGERSKHVLCLHSSHLDAPYNDPSVVSPSMTPAINALRDGEIDKIVILTEAQARHMERLVGDSSKVSYLPHFQQESVSEDVVRNPRRVVSLARYHHVKNLPEAVRVIDLVRKEVPDVVYEVYGYGEEKASLQALVEELGLEQHVFLHDHSDETTRILKSARMLLMTSKQEGQPLSQMEALAEGTPVVSYDTPYGASENIRDGVDGFVVTYGSGRVEAAAAAVVRLLQDDALFERFSDAARQVSQRFSQERFAQEWTELIAGLGSD